MNIIKNYVTNKIVRPHKKITEIRGLVIHWTGCNQPSADKMRQSLQNSTREASYHYAIDYNDGHIVQTLPENEVGWHVGASSYTTTKKKICGSGSPNSYLIGIECCVENVNKPKPSSAQRKYLIEFCADFLNRYGLTSKNLYLHHDITGKDCHTWFVNNPDDWEQLKLEINSKMNKESNIFPKEMSVIAKSGLKIRKKPIKDSDVIKAVPYGTKFTVIAVGIYFAKIKYGSGYAYCAKEYLK